MAFSSKEEKLRLEDLRKKERYDYANNMKYVDIFLERKKRDDDNKEEAELSDRCFEDEKAISEYIKELSPAFKGATDNLKDKLSVVDEESIIRFVGYSLSHLIRSHLENKEYRCFFVCEKKSNPC